ncbi:MAG: SDR family NAD(P)-dependent oxidoreductase, partial [Betaproteobacteria bacterium]|nr:SDR family NAD(P)-dependent oxidoreductase [Betaproteobacteria bacterium]
MPQAELNGKVAVITGAGRGIGRAIAQAYAAAGAAVCCSARTTAEIEDACRGIERAGGRALAVTADVTDPASMQALFAQAAKTFGGVDLVLANAGDSMENKPLEDSDPALWRRTVEVNLVGTFNTVHAAIPHLRRRGGGKILVTGSGMGHRGAPGRSAYAA